MDCMARRHTHNLSAPTFTDAQGWRGSPPANRQLLKTDPDLGLLRQQREFQALLKSIEGRLGSRSVDQSVRPSVGSSIRRGTGVPPVPRLTDGSTNRCHCAVATSPVTK